MQAARSVALRSEKEALERESALFLLILCVPLPILRIYHLRGIIRPASSLKKKGQPVPFDLVVVTTTGHQRRSCLG